MIKRYTNLWYFTLLYFVIRLANCTTAMSGFRLFCVDIALEFWLPIFLLISTFSRFPFFSYKHRTQRTDRQTDRQAYCNAYGPPAWMTTTRGSAVAEGPRDAPCQLAMWAIVTSSSSAADNGQTRLPHNCTINRISKRLRYAERLWKWLSIIRIGAIR